MPRTFSPPNLQSSTNGKLANKGTKWYSPWESVFMGIEQERQEEKDNLTLQLKNLEKKNKLSPKLSEGRT